MYLTTRINRAISGKEKR